MLGGNKLGGKRLGKNLNILRAHLKVLLAHQKVLRANKKVLHTHQSRSFACAMSTRCLAHRGDTEICSQFDFW